MRALGYINKQKINKQKFFDHQYIVNGKAINFIEILLIW